MADQSKLIFVNTDAEYEESSALDSLQYASFKTSNFTLDDTLLGRLVNAVNVSTGLPDGNKFVVTNSSGQFDQSFLNLTGLGTQIDHGDLIGLGDDDHTQYILVDGTRAFTGDQSLGNNKLTNVGTGAASITGALDAVNKAYVDAVAQGLRPKGNVVAATTANIDVSSPPATIDGVTPVLVDRILVKDQTDATENGIYEYQGSGVPLVRALDQDNNPLAEIVNGVYIPQVLGGTVNGGLPFFISSVGSGNEGLHNIGIDDIIWEAFTSPSQLSAGQGISISSSTIAVRLAASSGIKFVLDELAIEPADFAGTGLQDDGSDNLEIDFADTATEMGTSRAVAASDLSGNGTNQGANILGADPTTISQSTGTDIQSILEDLSDAIENVSVPKLTMTVDTGETIAIGDFMAIVGNDLTAPLDITTTQKPIGIANTAGTAGQVVEACQKGDVLESVLTGATAGAQYFWDGSALVATVPSGGGSRVWRVGYAKNATDLFIDWELIKKNS